MRILSAGRMISSSPKKEIRILMNDTNQIKAMDVLDDEQNAFDAIAVK